MVICAFYDMNSNPLNSVRLQYFPCRHPGFRRRDLILVKPRLQQALDPRSAAPEAMKMEASNPIFRVNPMCKR